MINAKEILEGDAGNSDYLPNLSWMVVVFVLFTFIFICMYIE